MSLLFGSNAPVLPVADLIWVGEKEIVIVPFVQKLLEDIVVAFVNNLKDIEPQGDIKLEITR